MAFEEMSDNLKIVMAGNRRKQLNRYGYVTIHKAIYDALVDYLADDDTILEPGYHSADLGLIEASPSQYIRLILEEPYHLKFQKPAYELMMDLTGTDRIRLRFRSRNEEMFELDSDECELRLIMAMLDRGIVVVNPYHDEDPRPVVDAKENEF